MAKKLASKTEKPPRTPQKRGPKEERLIITDDPETALALLLLKKSQKPRP